MLKHMAESFSMKFTRTRLTSSTYHDSWQTSIDHFKYQASAEKVTECCFFSVDNKAHETRGFELDCKRTMCAYSIPAGDLSQDKQLRNTNVS